MAHGFVVVVGVAAGVAWYNGLFSSIETRLTEASNTDQLKLLLDGGALDKLDSSGVERVLLAARFHSGPVGAILAAGALDKLDSAGVVRVLLAARHDSSRVGAIRWNDCLGAMLAAGALDKLDGAGVLRVLLQVLAGGGRLSAMLAAGALDQLDHAATQCVLDAWLKRHSELEVHSGAIRWTFESLVQRLNYPSLRLKAVETLRIARAAAKTWTGHSAVTGILHLSTDELLAELLEAGALDDLSDESVRHLLADTIRHDAVESRLPILRDRVIARLTHVEALRVAIEAGSAKAALELASQEALEPENIKLFRDALEENYNMKMQVAEAWLVACGEWAESQSAAHLLAAQMRAAVLVVGRGLPLLIDWPAVTALASNLDPAAKADLTDLVLNLKIGVATRWGITTQQWVNIDTWKTQLRRATNNKRQYEDAPGSTAASCNKRARHARDIRSVTLAGSELRV